MSSGASGAGAKLWDFTKNVIFPIGATAGAVALASKAMPKAPEPPKPPPVPQTPEVPAPDAPVSQPLPTPEEETEFFADHDEKMKKRLRAGLTALMRTNPDEQSYVKTYKKTLGG